MKKRKFKNLTLRQRIGKIRPSDVIAWIGEQYAIPKNPRESFWMEFEVGKRKKRKKQSRRTI